MKLSRQITGFQINNVETPTKGDSPFAKFVFILTDGSVTHRTCLDKELRIVQDSIIETDFENTEIDPKSLLFKKEL